MRRVISVILVLSFFFIAVFAGYHLIREHRERGRKVPIPILTLRSSSLFLRSLLLKILMRQIQLSLEKQNRYLQGRK